MSATEAVPPPPAPPPKRPEGKRVQNLSFKDRILLEQEKFVPLAIAGGFLLFGAFSFVVYSWILPGGHASPSRAEARTQVLEALDKEHRLRIGPYVVTDAGAEGVEIRDEEGWLRAPSYAPVTIRIDAAKGELVLDHTTSSGSGPREVFSVGALEAFSVQGAREGSRNLNDIIAKIRGEAEPRRVLRLPSKDPADPGRAEALAEWLTRKAKPPPVAR